MTLSYRGPGVYIPAPPIESRGSFVPRFQRGASTKYILRSRRARGTLERAYCPLFLAIFSVARDERPQESAAIFDSHPRSVSAREEEHFLQLVSNWNVFPSTADTKRTRAGLRVDRYTARCINAARPTRSLSTVQFACDTREEARLLAHARLAERLRLLVCVGADDDANRGARSPRVITS